MLNKLLKYNLKDKFKILIIFYILSIFFAISTRVFSEIANSVIMNIIASVLSGVTISMIFNIFINNLMRDWVRFSQNLYGDESYLTHTLPVKKSTIYLSKMLSCIISLLVSFTVVGLSLFIAYYSKENIQFVKGILLPFAKAYDSTILKILVAVLLVLFLEFLNGVQSGFTGIILGHRLNSGKIGFSVLFGFMIYGATQVVAVISVFVVGLFNRDILDLYKNEQITNVQSIKTVIYIAIAVYTVIIIALYFINVKLFKKGVNVD